MGHIKTLVSNYLKLQFEAIQRNFRSKVLYLIGLPGIGKSSIIEESALELVDDIVQYRLGYISDPADILGLPKVENGLTKFMTPEQLKNVYEDTNKGEKILLFLDEFNRTQKSILNIVLEILLDRAILGRKLSKNVIIAAGGNTGSHMVTKFDDAISDRLLTIEITIEDAVKEFESYMSSRNLDIKSIEKLSSLILQSAGKDSLYISPRSIDQAITMAILSIDTDISIGQVISEYIKNQPSLLSLVLSIAEQYTLDNKMFVKRSKYKDSFSKEDSAYNRILKCKSKEEILNILKSEQNINIDKLKIVLLSLKSKQILSQNDVEEIIKSVNSST